MTASENTKLYLFSYGTLQNELVQLEVFGRKLLGSVDKLRGYKTSTIKLKGEAFHSESEQYLIAVNSNKRNDLINGIVLEITEEELILADQYEPEEYKREKVVLESGKEAWIYVAAETLS